MKAVKLINAGTYDYRNRRFHKGKIVMVSDDALAEELLTKKTDGGRAYFEEVVTQSEPSDPNAGSGSGGQGDDTGDDTGEGSGGGTGDDEKSGEEDKTSAPTEKTQAPKTGTKTTAKSRKTSTKQTQTKDTTESKSGDDKGESEAGVEV